jgi:PAS domain S-box-containing protein
MSRKPWPELEGNGQALAAAIVESSDDAIVSKTLDGDVLSWNAGASRLFGYAPEEIVGRSITTIIPPELWDEEREILRKVRRGERIDHFDTIRLTKDGRRIPISLTVSPVRNAQGTIIAASKVARDISERISAAERLREADRQKDAFLALIAHELRNPLAPIRYALELTKRPELSAAQHRNALAIIERQTAHMSRLLDDLLDVSRITRGALELRKQFMELQAIVLSAVEACRPLLEAKRQRLTISLPEEPVHLEADSVRLAQVFSNLLINAAKFGNANGKVEIQAVVEARTVQVTVRDDGVGISQEMMPRLFTMFCQDPLHRREGGLGVGLCLVRELVALHGGAVRAHSGGVNCGSEFTVTLPVAAETEAACFDYPLDCAERSGLRVLVVDDNTDATDCCKTLLETAGHQVATAYGARRALELGANLQPQVILLDIGLPDFSGYEVAQRIRATEWGEHAVLVALTGWGQPKDRQRALEAGFDWHVSKPIHPQDLQSFLTALAMADEGGASVFGHRLRPHSL